MVAGAGGCHDRLHQTLRRAEESFPTPLFWVVPLACLGGQIWIALRAAVQRCHDLNKSGWILLPALTVVACPVLVVYLALARGAPGPNIYCAAPRWDEMVAESILPSLDGRIGRARYWIRTFAVILTWSMALGLLSRATYLRTWQTPEVGGGGLGAPGQPRQPAGAHPTRVLRANRGNAFRASLFAAIAACVRR